MLSSSLGLQAGLKPVYTNEADFLAEGIISESTNFDSYSNSITLPGNNFALGSVIHTNPENVIVGPDLGVGNTRSLMANSVLMQVTGEIGGHFSLFGLRLGILSVEGMIDPYLFKTLNTSVDVSLTTNLGAYSFAVTEVPINAQGLKFLGFALDDPNEHFTGFEFTSRDYSFSGPAITDLQLGNPSVATPDSATTLGMFGVVLAGLLSLTLHRRLHS